MTELLLKPKRGGFLRSFGCGWVIREYLLGHGPEDSPVTNIERGAPQADIFYHYKMSLLKVTAEDKAARQEERQAKREKRSIEPSNIENLTKRYVERMPYKANGCRYHSFVVYFSNLRRLHWVEPSGFEEASQMQEHYAAGQPRRYYRLTAIGRNASDRAWSNPYHALYGRL